MISRRRARYSPKPTGTTLLYGEVGSALASGQGRRGGGGSSLASQEVRTGGEKCDWPGNPCRPSSGCAVIKVALCVVVVAGLTVALPSPAMNEFVSAAGAVFLVAGFLSLMFLFQYWGWLK